MARLERSIDTAIERLPVKMRAVIEALQSLRGIAQLSAVSIMAEVGELSRFEHPRQLMGYSGIVSREHSSGERIRRGAISKAGNARARTTAIEVGWLWLTHQPDSDLTRWARVGDQKGRIRRITIVALARKLMVALWRYLETGLVPTGAVLGNPAI